MEPLKVGQALQHLIDHGLIQLDVKYPPIKVGILYELRDNEKSEFGEHFLDVLILVNCKEVLALLDMGLVHEVSVELLHSVIHLHDGVNRIVDLSIIVRCLHLVQKILVTSNSIPLLLNLAVDTLQTGLRSILSSWVSQLVALGLD